MDQPTEVTPEQSASSPTLLHDRRAEKDMLDFGPYTETLLDIIRDPQTTGPLVMGLFGTWGSGKTSLMGFVHQALRETEDFRIVWFDAWKYEKQEALWRALLLRVIDSLRERHNGEDVTPDELQSKLERLEQALYRDVEWQEKGGLSVDWGELAKGTAKGALRLSFAFLPGFRVLTEAAKAAQGELGKGEDVKSLLDAFRRDVIEQHQAQLRSIEQFQRQLEGLVEEYVVKNNQRLVVFVDDLDRCLPEKSIEVLEAIKVFLDVKGCIFILGLDQDLVARGIRVKYQSLVADEGNAQRMPIDGAAYLEKIIQLPFRLPPIEPEQMEPFIRGLATFPDPRCARVFAVGLQTNPRKVKRAVNVYLFIARLAKRREISVKLVRLAKIVVIYHSHAELYELLRVNPALMRDLEDYVHKQTVPTGKQDPLLQEPMSAHSAPVPASLLTTGLQQVLMLFSEDKDGCFRDIAYEELVSYFTLTRGTIAETPSEISPQRLDPVGMVTSFVIIPAGEFRMGSSEEDCERLLVQPDEAKWVTDWKRAGRFKTEQPEQQVTLAVYTIGKYPVTNAAYQAFVRATAHRAPSHWFSSKFPDVLASHPVVNVSWHDAVAYCRWLREELLGLGQIGEYECIRLPTEAEWEKAARGIGDWVWPWGNSWKEIKCNTKESSIRATTPVGKYSPEGDSPYGVVDMAGNVFEWCSTRWHEAYPLPQLDEWEETYLGGDNPRVVRGGSWVNSRARARAAYRNKNRPNGRYPVLGFRCCLAMSGRDTSSEFWESRTKP